MSACHVVLTLDGPWPELRGHTDDDERALWELNTADIVARVNVQIEGHWHIATYRTVGGTLYVSTPPEEDADGSYQTTIYEDLIVRRRYPWCLRWSA